MRVIVSKFVTGMVMIVFMFMLMRSFRSADGWLFFSGFRGRFSGLLDLLFSDCQWVTFRVLSMGITNF